MNYNQGDNVISKVDSLMMGCVQALDSEIYVAGVCRLDVSHVAY